MTSARAFWIGLGFLLKCGTFVLGALMLRSLFGDLLGRM
jgi:hypothetical protein